MLRHRTTAFVCVCLVAASAGCDAARKTARPPRPAPERADARVRALADAYLDGYFQRNPDQVTLFGVPGPPSRRAARQLASTRSRPGRPRRTAGSRRRSRSIPPPSRRPPLRGTYAIVREALEASIGVRVCRNELWTVSQIVNGWQVQDGYTVTIQPVGTDEARKEALARWSRLPQLRRHRDRQPARGAARPAIPRRRATSASSSTRWTR